MIDDLWSVLDLKLTSYSFTIEKSDCIQQVVEGINSIKYGNELQSYKTGSVNGVKARIKLFTEGVEKILDSK